MNRDPAVQPPTAPQTSAVAAPDSEPGRFSEPRGFLSRASDEVAAWFGNRDALRRRQWDEAAGDHSGQGPAQALDDDAAILSQINQDLTRDPLLDASRILVDVQAGGVTLSGAVSTSADRRRAEDLANAVRGVSQVRNDLVVS